VRVHLVLPVVAHLVAQEARPSGPPPAPFERLKTLAGEWSGNAVWDQGGRKGRVPFRLSYRVTAGGKAVVETMFTGTPGEMVTVYHLDGGDVVLVHYCTSGNQPRMRRKAGPDPNDLDFECLGGTNMTEADSHMHSVRLTLVDAQHLRGTWSSKKGEVVEWVAEADLVRQP
jgi:hypothetical protein